MGSARDGSVDDGGGVTRLAPSPTGALHLGNARTFLVNWAMARQRGWRVLLRIEDLDGPRIKAGADAAAIEDLRWLGIDWDSGPTYQSADLSPYQAALAALDRQGVLYPCTCTRRDIEQALSAPHADGQELRYPGTCRERRGVGFRVPGSGFRPQDGAALRVIVPDEVVQFTDEIAGPQSINVQQQVGDFIVATKAGLPAYQLAVVVDDARQGVTDVVRGDDLMPSAARQWWLYHMLDQLPRNPLTPLPRWWHLPLVVGPDGRRLAKRHGDTRIRWYRQQNVPPQRIIGLIAHWCGLTAERRASGAAEFAAAFDLARLPRHPITFTAEDHAWLING